MPSTLPVNMQQVIQMGTHVEKLQHTIQTLPNVTAQQLNQERIQGDNLKHNQIQDINPYHHVEKIDPKTRRKNRIKVLKKNHPHYKDNSLEPPLPEDPYRGKINVVA